MIELKNLSKSFTYYEKEQGIKGSLKNLFNKKKLNKEAVKNISFTIDSGEIVGFLGPNGAGKTTTLKMLSGILYPSSGDVKVNGHTPWKRQNEFKKDISIILGQKSQLQFDLPAVESFYLNKCIYGIDDNSYKKTIGDLADLLNVNEKLNIQVRRLSLGERMKMELIAALIHKPKILFLDEPTIGLDIVSQKNIREFFKEYNRVENATILLTSHYLNDIENLCNRTIIINNGNIQYDGETLDLKKYEKKKYIYFQINEEELSKLREKQIAYKTKGSDICIEIDKDTLNETLVSIVSSCNVNNLRVEDYPLEKIITSMYLA